ncbi:MAG: putative signal transducing protein [Planctomycetota bacterium]|jgi:hypothetical protein
MAKPPKKTRESQTNLQELGVVTLTEDIEQAREYETLLKNNDIPAMIKKQHESMADKGFAVMVPEEYLDEAHVVIESQNAYDDFYDFASKDEDENEFNGDFFDDDF